VQGSHGIKMLGSGSTIYNIGALTGSVMGIEDAGGNNLIVNAGEVTGANIGIIVQPIAGRAGTDSSVFNFGEVHADNNGIFANSNNNLVVNYGLVEIDERGAGNQFDTGVEFYAQARGGMLFNYGEIDGGNGRGVTGAQDVLNHGRIAGDVLLDTTDDLYFGLFGWVVGDVEGRAGDDRLVGGFYQDTLHGGGGADLVQGARGWDNLDGGRDSDILVGGPGRDEFSFQVGSGKDTLWDFENNRDTLILDRDLVRSGLTAEIVGGDLTLAFGTGDTLVVSGITSVAQLLNDIVLV
jgi:RTX calcium-binding nonapeptide repeat (4 copies)